MQTFLLFGKCFFDFGGDPPLGSFAAYLASTNSHPQDVYSGAFTVKAYMKNFQDLSNGYSLMVSVTSQPAKFRRSCRKF
jgi:hypothetical protein